MVGASDWRDERLERPTGRVSLVLAGTVALVLGWTCGLMSYRDGANLTWDNADYVARGLRLDRAAWDGPWVLAPARFVAAVMRERPRPPLPFVVVALTRHFAGRFDVPGTSFVATAASVWALGALICLGSWWFSGGGRPALATFALLAGSRMLTDLSRIIMAEIPLAALLLAMTLALGQIGGATSARSRRLGCVALGIATGFAFLTKLTALMFAAGMLPVVLRLIWRDRTFVRLFAWAAGIAVIVAGPWYVHNGSKALVFAGFSMRYNVLTSGRGEAAILATLPRLRLIESEVPGRWGLLALCVGMAVILSSVSALRDRAWRVVFASACGMLVAALVVLLRTDYFDARFLAPVWPTVVLAVALGVDRVLRASHRTGFAVAVVVSWGLLAGPQVWENVTAQRARLVTPSAFMSGPRLIDHLTRHSSRRADHTRIGMVGNTREWNVSKLDVYNELRAQPATAEVTFNLSALGPSRFRKRLGVLDAVLVQRMDTANRARIIENAAGNPVLLAVEAEGPLGPAFWREQGFVSLDLPSDLERLPFSVWVRPAGRAREKTETGASADSGASPRILEAGLLPGRP